MLATVFPEVFMGFPRFSCVFPAVYLDISRGRDLGGVFYFLNIFLVATFSCWVTFLLGTFLVGMFCCWDILCGIGISIEISSLDYFSHVSCQ